MTNEDDPWNNTLKLLVIGLGGIYSIMIVFQVIYTGMFRPNAWDVLLVTCLILLYNADIRFH